MKKIECYQILHADEVKDPDVDAYVMNNLSMGLVKQIREQVELKKEVLKSGKVKYTLKVFVKEKKDGPPSILITNDQFKEPG